MFLMSSKISLAGTASINFFFSPDNIMSFFFLLLRATPVAYGCSQARGQIGVVAVNLNHSRSNSRSKPYLQPTPQLTATLDP